MGIKVKGYDALKINMSRAEERVLKHSIEWLDLSGKIIANEAKMRVPVDEGDLENAIKSDRDPAERGPNNRQTVRVYVDVDALNLEEDHAGFDYSVWIHEAEYKLGPKSLLKDSLTDRGVGPKFLERALADNIQRLRSIYEDRIRRALK